MPAIVTTEVDKWARFALTGDSTSATPTNAQLAFLRPAVIRAFFDANPCAEDPDNAGQTSFSGDTQAADTAALEEALGYLVAMRYVGSPAGRSYAGNVVSTKVGPVTRTRKEVSVDDAQRYLLVDANAARARISCIRTAIAAFNASSSNPGLYGAAGYRRAAGYHHSIQGAVLGAAEDGTVDV